MQENNQSDRSVSDTGTDARGVAPREERDHQLSRHDLLAEHDLLKLAKQTQSHIGWRLGSPPRAEGVVSAP